MKTAVGTSDPRRDVSKELHALCDALGLEYEFVKSMFSTPTTITATVFKKNENGAKYVLDEMSSAVTEDIVIQVKT